MENALLKKYHTELRKSLLARRNIGSSIHHRREYEVKAMCDFFGVSRAAYYAWVKRIEEPDPDAEQKGIGPESLSSLPQDLWVSTGDLVDRSKMWCHHQSQGGFTLDEPAGDPFRGQKTQNLPENDRVGAPIIAYPNLLNRDFSATQPNQKWVTDVTYILTREGWAYLSTIKDLYDGFIVAHQFGRENSVALVQQNLRKAKQKEKVTDGLVLHSDQGQQYTSQAYYVLTQRV